MLLFDDEIRQAAALPVRDGDICLVTSRNGKRWVAPKGCMEPGKTAGEIALQEAWEEAGLVGVLEPEPIGSYVYQKDGLTCHVIVFLMEVTSESAVWPEQSFRQRRWLSAAKAAERVADPGLRALIEGAAVGRTV
ncbi:MAG TPA: NUDIX hydrolase [Planctomycetales bacterium]|jgi:8-oxo-dGTP pyrophosphatase MutT (NUDIX family)|nr:NUDIX hydrolase [Planctomycetales bacterium]